MTKKQRPDLLDNRLMGAMGMRVKADDVTGLKDRAREMFRKAMDSDAWSDADFMDDVRQATLQGAHPAALAFFWTMVTVLAVFFLWAGVARLDEVSRGQGVVSPSGKVQAVGSPEGGVVAEIFVKAGDIVKPGQTLVRLDDTVAAAGVGEKEARRYYLQATMTRLDAELNDKEPVWPEEMKQKVPQIVEEAQRQYESRKAELESTTGVLKERVEQRRQELNDARRQAGSLGQAYRLAKQELDMTRPYLDSGAISKVDVLRLERAVVEAQKDLNTAQLSVPAASAALREAENALNEGVLKVKNESRDELAKARDEFARLGETVQADVNRAERTVLKSPIHAEVKQVLVNTVGQAVQANANIVELVPLEETLLVEAKVRPQDVAFIRPGLPAMVKLTAYDFSIYGGLKGVVESLSGDSFTEKTAGGREETFFKILVRTDRNYLEHGGRRLPIRSGMVANVDVLTGKKTVLQYLLKPINKARESALSER